MCGPSTNNNEYLREKLHHLISLLNNNDNAVYKWSQYLFFFQAALFTAYFALDKYWSTSNNELTIYAIYILPILGIITAFFFGLEIRRERQWVKWYLQQIRYIDTKFGADKYTKIFPSKNEKEDVKCLQNGWDNLEKQRVGKIATWITILCVIIISIWSVLIVLSLCIIITKFINIIITKFII